MLRLTAATVFGEELVRGGAGDPTQTFYNGQPQKVYQKNGQYVLSLALPMVSKEEVKLHRSVVDELIIHIGNWKRNISLPTGLARLEIAGAKYEGDRLNILFAMDAESAPNPQELQATRWDTLKARLQGGVSGVAGCGEPFGRRNVKREA